MLLNLIGIEVMG